MLGLLTLFVGFLAGGRSVSAVPPELALWANPAALGRFQGLVITGSVQDRTGWLASALGPVACAVNQNRQVRLGLGTTVRGPFRLGLALLTGPPAEVTLGALYRVRFLSLGARVTSHPGHEIGGALGLALRPGTDRLTLYADLELMNLKRGSSASWRWTLGMNAQVLPGIHLTGGLEVHLEGQDPRIFAGLDVALTNLRVGGAYRQEQPSRFTVALSRSPYPSWIPGRRYLTFRLQKSLSEDPQAGLFHRRPSFTELLLALHRAAHDPGVRGVLLEVENPNALTWNQIEELHQALDSLRHQGKPVAAYLEMLTLKGWYLASGADRILMPPTGMVLLVNLGSEKVYLKRALDKLGVEVQAPHIGRYKSAVEPLIRDRMSEADREQTRALLQDIAGVVREALRRRATVDSARLDSLLYAGFLGDAEEACSLGLVDTVVPRHRLRKTLEHLWKVRRSRTLEAYAAQGRALQTFRWGPSPGEVAVVSLEGSIVTGQSGTSPWPIIGGKYIGSSSVVSLLQRLGRQDQVKAVVLRVNSPGGSALASDIIWQAIQDLRKKKPVIVSMGYLAASGGYYISCGADRIFADRSTITGSIGILATKLAFGRLFQRWGLTRDTVLLSPHADGWSLWRPLTPEELAALERYLHRGYQVFLRRVSAGRGMPETRVDSIGQGRVWSGLQARHLGLVDTLGGVAAAIQEAARRAGLKPGEYRVAVYTTQPSTWGPLNLLRTETWQVPLRLWLEEPYLYHLGPMSLP